MKTRLLVLFWAMARTLAIAQKPAQQYQQTQRQLAKGWNTQSVLSQVLLPEGLSVNIGFKSNSLTDNRYLHESYISTKQKRPEQLKAGYHAYDGSYTECTVVWEGTTAKVETATQNNDLVVLVTPLKIPTMTQNLVIEVAMLWNRAENVQLLGNQITAKIGEKSWKISSTSTAIADFLPLKGRYLSFKLNEQIGISVGKVRNLEAIKALINAKRTTFEIALNKYGAHQETYLAQQSVLAWNMIYDSERQAVIAPVSRNWNSFFGGHYVLFDWDTYLSGLMVGFDNKALAYANVVEVTKTIDQWGMVPNYVSAHGLGSPDRQRYLSSGQKHHSFARL